MCRRNLVERDNSSERVNSISPLEDMSLGYLALLDPERLSDGLTYPDSRSMPHQQGIFNGREDEEADRERGGLSGMYS